MALGYHGRMRSSDATPPADASPGRPTPSAASLLVAAFGTLMLALAAGAVWLLLCLGAPGLDARAWPALPLALLVGPMVRAWMTRARWPAAGMAAVAMVLAAAYMRMLLIASNLAGNFGMDFMQALRHAGPGMLFHLAWLSVSHGDIAFYAASALLAGWLAWRIGPRGRD